MGSGASTIDATNAKIDDDDGPTLEELCRWIKSQGVGHVGDDLASKCAASGLSAQELLLHMDRESLLQTLNTSYTDDERKQALSLIQSGRKALRREYRVSLKELPDAIDKAIYVFERFPMVLDPSGQATRFLRYQRSAVLMVGNPKDMAPESLRKHLVAALKHGTWLILDFDMLNTIELEQFFAPTAFPSEILNRQALFRPDVFTKLLRDEDGDPAAFIVSDQFKFIVLCRTDQPPPKTALAMHILHVQMGEKRDEDTGSSGENDQLAKALGVGKEVKRNSLEMVEAAFDDDMDVVKKCLDQNYDIESCDGHGHSAMSEAACQGHTGMVQFLLERGADPNKLNDEKRSALFRASYNGHVETVRVLLESGADPRVMTKQSETAFDVAKTDEVREVIQTWDITKTDKLLEQRRKVIEQQWQQRISNHVEREQYARMKIHEELIDLATKGDAEALAERFEQLIDEALEASEKPRASADIRDEKGSTLLAIAAQYDHADVADLFLTRWKSWKDLAHETANQGTTSMQKDLATKQALMAKTLKANVNARDCRGWTPVAIAVFHESKKCLRKLLENGADPKLKNQYNKNAFDFAKDDIDAALNVVKSRAEIRQVLLDWENERRSVNGESGVDSSAAAASSTSANASSDLKSTVSGKKKGKKTVADNTSKTKSTVSGGSPSKPSGGAKGKSAKK